MRRIGVLMSTGAQDAPAQARLAAFLQGLQEFGWAVGRNVRIDIRWPAADPERTRREAAELVGLAPEVIMATGSATVAPLQQLTRSVPIVFVIVLFRAGFVDSLARPGGNATGFTSFEFGLAGKWLELLKQIVPGATRAAVIRDPGLSAGIGQFAAIQSMAPSLGVDVVPVNVRDPGEIERALAAFVRPANSGLIVTGSALTVIHRNLIIDVAARHKLPAVYYESSFAHAGGLISYGLISWISIAAQPATSIASSRARNRQTYRCRLRLNTSWSSTSKPPRHSASKCHRRYSPAQTR